MCSNLHVDVSLPICYDFQDGDSSDEEADGGGGVGEDAANSDNEESDYSDEDSDEEPPEEREDLQKRIKEMKKVSFDVHTPVYHVIQYTS